MQRHASFDLWLHDDAELAAVLGSPVVRRTTIHQWALSCVERIECADGKTCIYKVQRPPTVEPTFYEQARSSLLVKAQTLPIESQPSALLLQDVHAPRLCDRQLRAEDGLRLVDEILAQIGQIAGELPAVADLRGKAAWCAYTEVVRANVQAQLDSGKQPWFTPELAAQVAERSASPEIDAALDTPMGYVHNDLLGSNVLLAGDGYRVIDWQRPIWGPVAIDRATLLESARIDPRPHVPPGILLMRWMLRIGFHAERAPR